MKDQLKNLQMIYLYHYQKKSMYQNYAIFRGQQEKVTFFSYQTKIGQKKLPQNYII